MTEEKNNDLNIAYQEVKAQPIFSNPSKVSEDTNTTTFSSIFDAKYYNDENSPQKKKRMLIISSLRRSETILLQNNILRNFPCCM